MATVSPAAEQWDVTVSFSEEYRQYRLPPETTIFAVRSKWEKDTNATPNTIELISSQGQRLADEMSLSEVGETYPSTRLVELTARSVSHWKVIVSAIEDEYRRLYILPPYTRISVVKSMWMQDTGISENNLALVSELGDPVKDDRSLDDVGELHPGSCLVKLTAEQTTDVSIEVFRGPFDSKKISVCLSKGPECLLRAVRELFGFPPGRSLRLRTPESPLEVAVSLRDQGVTEHSVLQIELEFRIQLHELWTNDIRIFNPVFSSEEAEQLRSTDLSQPQRVVYGKATLDTAESLIEALMPHGALHCAEFGLQLHIKKDVAVSVGRTLGEINVWPAILTGSIGLHHRTVMYGDILCPRADPICNLNLPDHGLLHTDPVGICLKLRSGRRYMTRAPLLGAIADVRAAARAKDRGDGLILKCGDQVIADDANLSDVGINVGAEIAVYHKILDLSVFMGGRIVSWCTARRSLSFSDIAHVLYGATNIPYSTLNRKTFYCVGCGRGIRKTEEEFQTVPVACCRVQSLRLAETAPRKLKDAGTQGARLTSVCSSAQTQLMTADPSMQAAVLRHRVASQTEDGTVVSVEMTENQHRIDELQGQLSDLKVKIDNLKAKLTGAGRSIKQRDLQINNLKANLKDADHSIRQQGLQINNLNARLNDADRSIKQRDSQISDLNAKLKDADRAIIQPDSQSDNLKVNISEGEKVPRRLYLVNCTRHRGRADFLLSPALRQPVMGRDLRAAVAAEFGVSPRRLRLEQLSGTGQWDYVDVRGAGGEWSNDCGDASGDIRPRSELTDLAWRDLHDDAVVTLAPGRQSVIVVDESQ